MAVPPSAFVARVKEQPIGTLNPSLFMLMAPTVSTELAPETACKLTEAVPLNNNCVIVWVGTLVTVALVVNWRISPIPVNVLFGFQLVDT